MKDRIPTPGKEGRMLITPEVGGTSFYAIVTMADDPVEAGTPLSKANLLSDAVATSYGLPSSPEPTVDLALFKAANFGKTIGTIPLTSFNESLSGMVNGTDFTKEFTVNTAGWKRICLVFKSTSSSGKGAGTLIITRDEDGELFGYYVGMIGSQSTANSIAGASTFGTLVITREWLNSAANLKDITITDTTITLNLTVYINTYVLAFNIVGEVLG